MLQSRNRDTDVDHGLVDTVGEGEGGTERAALTCTHDRL